MGTSHMVLCAGKYMCVGGGLMFLYNFDYIINVIFQIFINAEYQ